MILLSDDKIGNNPMYSSFGDTFLQEEIQVCHVLLTVLDMMNILVLVWCQFLWLVQSCTPTAIWS